MVMVSTLSFTVSKHYCSNILVDTAVVKPAKSCGMHDQNQNQHNKEKDSCCDDEVKLIEGQDELHVSGFDFSLDVPVEFVTFSFVYVFSPAYDFKPDVPFKKYHPPEYTSDFQILHQVFLI
jgi:hypothetical protein